MKFGNENIKIIPLLYIAFVLCTTGLPLYSSGFIFMKPRKKLEIVKEGKNLTGMGRNLMIIERGK